MNYRRAALLGLNSPLSAVMMAVLGIWPSDDEPPLPAYGGGGGAVARPRPPRLARPRRPWIEVPFVERDETDDEDVLLLAAAL